MSDYRNVFENIKMPYITEIYTKDKLTMKTTVKSIKVNQGIADSMFDVSGYKEYSMANMMAGMKTGNSGNNNIAVDSGTANNQPAAPQNTDSGKSNSMINNMTKRKLPF
jgi:hypothetical protein